jgi:hypothetical protein
MRFEPVAPTAMINKHRADIYAMFDTTGFGESQWSSLTATERELFCIQAGYQRSSAQIPLSKMRPDTRKQLLLTIKSISRATRLFDNVSLSDFG